MLHKGKPLDADRIRNSDSMIMIPASEFARKNIFDSWDFDQTLFAVMRLASAF